MKEHTSIQEADRLVTAAIVKLPQLTTFGVGLHFSYLQQDKAAIDAEVLKQQDELFSPHALSMVAASSDWLKTHRRDINQGHTSFYLKHVVERWRRAFGDPDPYVHNGCFIAAGVGRGLRFMVDGPNVVFQRQLSVRQRIDNELAADGQRLRGTDIVQEFSEDPLMLPCSPHIVERNVDIHALARKLGIIEEPMQPHDATHQKAITNGVRA